MSAEITTEPRVSVIGLGNILLGDDGFGPCAVELFRSKYECGPDAEILDLGTPGVDLAPYLYGRELVVLVDALDLDHPAGTLCMCRWDAIAPSQVNLRLTGHDPGLSEALTQLQMLNRAPRELFVIGAVPKSCEFNQRISSEIFRMAGTATDHIAGLLLDYGVCCVRRPSSLRPNLWWLDHSAKSPCCTDLVAAVDTVTGRTMRSSEPGISGPGLSIS
jgi:hydrogenase maturation protease